MGLPMCRQAGGIVPMWPGPLGKELWMAQETAVFPNSPVTRGADGYHDRPLCDSADLTLPETGDPAAPFTDRNAVSDWAEAGVGSCARRHPGRV